MKKYQAVPFPDETKYALSEAPFFDERTGIISFVDILAGRFVRIFPDGEKKVFDLNQPLGAAVPGEKPGDYIFAATDGIYLFRMRKPLCSLISSPIFFHGSAAMMQKKIPQEGYILAPHPLMKSLGLGEISIALKMTILGYWKKTQR